MRACSNWFSFDFRMVEIAGVVGRHVGGGRTRALQDDDQFSSVDRQRAVNDGSRNSGGALRSLKTNTKTAGRKRESSRVGGKTGTYSSKPCT